MRYDKSLKDRNKLYRIRASKNNNSMVYWNIVTRIRVNCDFRLKTMRILEIFYKVYTYLSRVWSRSSTKLVTVSHNKTKVGMSENSNANSCTP